MLKELTILSCISRDSHLHTQHLEPSPASEGMFVCWEEGGGGGGGTEGSSHQSDRGCSSWAAWRSVESARWSSAVEPGDEREEITKLDTSKIFKYLCVQYDGAKRVDLQVHFERCKYGCTVWVQKQPTYKPILRQK